MGNSLKFIQEVNNLADNIGTPVVDKEVIKEFILELKIMKDAWARDLAWIDFVEHLPKDHTVSPKIYDSLCKEWEIEMRQHFMKQREARFNNTAETLRENRKRLKW